MYSEQYFGYLALFTILAYFIVTDESVAKFFLLSIKILRINIERIYWMVRFHPLVTTNKITQWLMMRKYMKEIEKMQKEFSEK